LSRLESTPSFESTEPLADRLTLPEWPPVEDSGPNPLVQLIRARIMEFFRKPEAIFWVYGFPLMMAVALGIAFRTRPATVILVDVVAGPSAEKVATVLEAGSSDSTGEIGSVSSKDVHAAGESIRFEVLQVDEELGRQRLRTGKSQMLIVPGAASESEAQGELDGVALEYLYDPSRPESSLARRVVDDLMQRAAGREDAISASDTWLQEPGGRYIDFLIPGLMGASLMGGGLWGIGFVTVDMRVRNLLKRFVTTPMKKSDFLLGMMISRFLFMVTEVLLLLLFARWIFAVGVQGNWLLLLVLVLLGAITFAGVGMLVASRAKTLETASGLMNLVMLPMWVLSGIFFSPDRFPDVAQPVIQILPLTPLIASLRAVMIEGAGLFAVLPNIGIMIAWSVISFFLALRWFRWY